MALTGPERLLQYCKRSHLKQYELADLLQMHNTTLSHVISGKRRPGLDIAVRIEALTGIPVSAWTDSERGKTARRIARTTKTAAIGRVKNHVA
jgi:transcriptional regulator with XRE-family HTH domain